MSESDLLQSITSYWDLAGTMLTIYLSVISGYLLVAYLAGAKLTSSQAFIVTALFAVFSFITTATVISHLLVSYEYVDELRQIRPDRKYYVSPEYATALSVIVIGGIIASCKFMWDIRHPKTL